MIARAVLFLVLAMLWPHRAHAQTDTIARAPRWVSEFSTASGNILISGVTAGVTQKLRGGSFKDGFTRGAFGGVVIFAGKRIAVEDFYGAGLIGRQVTNVGASMVWNAGAGMKEFDRLAFPLWFGRLYWDRAGTDRVQFKFDATAVAYTIYGIAEARLQFDASQTLSFGAPVFRTENQVIDVGEREVGGLVSNSVVFLSDVPQWGQELLRRNNAHERVHVLQMDQLFLTMNADYDDRLLHRLPAGRAVARWVDVNASSTMLSLMARAIDDHGSRPWELEAIHLAR